MKKSNLLIALVVLISAIVIAATIFAIYWTGAPPSSHRYIVTAADLGEDWGTSSVQTPPEEWNINGSDNSAYVSMGYDNGIARTSGSLTLAIFATAEEANDTYLDQIKMFYDTSSGNWSSVNVSYGDHATLISLSEDQAIVYEQLLFMQKGTAVVVISIVSMNGSDVTISQVEDVARIQAQKLP